MIEKFFIEQGIRKVELDRYLAKELEKAGFTKSEIVKTPLVTRIVVNVTRPGLAIGKSGSNISQLTETIGKRFRIDNPQLEIKEIENQNLDAKAVANKMRATIERGFSWRSVVFKTMNDIRMAGALGIEVIVSGKITGKAGRKRKLRYFHGYIKKVGEQARLVDYAKTTAYPKVGAIGIKVRIIRPGTKFPDKVKIEDYIKKAEAAPPEGTGEKVAEANVEEAKGAEVAGETVAGQNAATIAVKDEEAKAGTKAEARKGEKQEEKKESGAQTLAKKRRTKKEHKDMKKEAAVVEKATAAESGEEAVKETVEDKK